jgi:hypothetical protein
MAGHSNGHGNGGDKPFNSLKRINKLAAGHSGHGKFRNRR